MVEIEDVISASSWLHCLRANLVQERVTVKTLESVNKHVRASEAGNAPISGREWQRMRNWKKRIRVQFKLRTAMVPIVATPARKSQRYRAKEVRQRTIPKMTLKEQYQSTWTQFGIDLSVEGWTQTKNGTWNYGSSALQSAACYVH